MTNETYRKIAQFVTICSIFKKVKIYHQGMLLLVKISLLKVSLLHERYQIAQSLFEQTLHTAIKS